MECYLDNSATTAVSPEAATLALHIMTEEYGNPSSLHRRGFLAERAMTEARGQVAAVLHCRPEEIIFTAGGTESNNIALLGAARAMKRRGNHLNQLHKFVNMDITDFFGCSFFFHIHFLIFPVQQHQDFVK